MILHICEDSRFVSLAKQQFEATNISENIFLVNSNKSKLDYIPQNNNVIIALPKSELHKQTINKYDYELIVFHNCNQKYKWEIINNSKSTTKLLWLAWGSDIYSLPKLSKSLLLPITENTTRTNFKENINISIDKLIRIILRKNKKQINAYKRVNYCAPVMSEDLHLLNRTYNININEGHFTYGFLSYYIGKENKQIFKGNNILIGNSAHPSSNHIDALHLIQNINEGDIITPLSYGGDSSYIKSVTNYGIDLFGDRFNALTELMPIDEYRNILFTCKAAFMYHQRQQALGNIIMLLWMGVKVYLDKKNPVFDFYIKKDVLVFSIDDFINEKSDNITELNSTQIEHNRKQLIKLYSYDNVVKETKQLIKQCIK